MVHLRIVAPVQIAERALELLHGSRSVSNVIYLQGAAHKPEGDVILADVAREDVSVIIDDLRELGEPAYGSLTMDLVDTAISKAAEQAERRAPGLASDAVVWEEVENRTSESTELSISFVAFMALAMLIASIGILLDQPILIIGAMVVGPEFGPLAGLSVAIVELRGRLVRRSLLALAIGFPAGILSAYLLVELLRLSSLDPETFPAEVRQLGFISDPDVLSFLVAYIAGTAGVLSLTSAKSGALIGVLISVTTIPAAAIVGVAAAYSDWDEMSGAAAQLGLNLFAIVLAGVATLYVQRRVYVSRRVAHLSDPLREAAGLPVGHSVKTKPRSRSSSAPGRSPRP